MSPRYVRREPSSRDNAVAAVASGVLAAGVGLAAFYVARILLSRDPLPEGRTVARVAREDVDRPRE